MKRYKTISVSALVFSLVFSSCSFEPAGEKPAPPVSNGPDTVRMVEDVRIQNKDSLSDCTARFIAGLPQTENNAFKTIEGKGYWGLHKQSFEEDWKGLQSQRLDSMKSWQEKNFSKLVNDSLTLFYPFSGPDFLHAHYLYPNTKTYILAALEPITDLPDILKLNDDNRKIFLQSVENSLRDIYHKSYFITNHMQDDLKTDRARGVLPVFYVFLVRTGHEILYVKKVGIAPDGTLTDSIPLLKDPSYVNGIQFTFRQQNSPDVKEMYYFSFDISDKGLLRKKGFIPYLKKQGKVNTFIKSASYLWHYSTFSVIRKTTLEISQTIFQDDTGIPWKFLNNDSMQVQFYGEYTRPVKDFGEYVFQPDLDSAYKKSNTVQKLPFHLGYHWGDKRQSFMLATKKDPE